MDDWGYDAEAEVAGCEKEVARLEREIEKLRDIARDDALERWRIWEDGFKAGLHTVNGEHRKNPYTPPLAEKLETT